MFYLTLQGYNNQAWIYNIAVRHQTGWLKKGDVAVNYSQPVRNKDEYWRSALVLTFEHLFSVYHLFFPLHESLRSDASHAN